MKFNEIKTAVHNIQKGTFTNIETCKVLKTKKAFSGDVITKTSHSTVRLGVTYDNMKATKEGRLNGSKPAENAGLPWGHWMEGEENFFIEHKGEIYLRVANSPNKSLVRYFRNNVEIPREEAERMCYTSEFSKGQKPEVMSVKIDNILHIG